MTCKKCKRELPENVLFCPWCGKKQVSESRKIKKRANGAGSVTKLSGRRKKPYWARATVNGTRVDLGTFPTSAEALQAIDAAVTSGVSTRYNATLLDIYEEWKAVHFASITKSGAYGYLAAWKFLEPSASVKMREIRTEHFQQAINRAVENGNARSTCEKVRQLSSQLCKKAMQDDLINKNYAEFLSLPKDERPEKNIFSEEEIQLLWNNSGDNTARIILTLIYTGLRINELFNMQCETVHLKERYLIGGLKTEAGRNRVIPIHPKIFPFIAEWYGDREKNRYLITNGKGQRMDANNFRDRMFYPTLIRLGILEADESNGPNSYPKPKKPVRLTPHSTRHTFASRMAKAGVKPEVLQQIIGHADFSTTAEVYIHPDIQQLSDAVDCL